MNVRIYVEGGGDQQATLAQCRAGFSRFFAKVVRDGHMPKVIACGSRKSTFDDFGMALNTHVRDTIVLLVDAEDVVRTADCWTHLRERDGWMKPAVAEEGNVYLMVRCMESWFLADKGALREFYGDKFLVKSLPAAMDVETVAKTDVAKSLEHATRPTGRKYHKTQHGFQILASLDPTKIENGSVHAKRLVAFLRTL